MIRTNDNTLYHQVVEVTINYLGPAAERFVSRQIQTHLDKAPEDITRSDLEKLIDWIRLAMALLTDDEKLVEEYSDNLRKLTKKTGAQHVRR